MADSDEYRYKKPLEEVVLDEVSRKELVNEITDKIRNELKTQSEQDASDLLDEIKTTKSRLEERRQKEAQEKQDSERDELVVGAVKEAGQNVENLGMLLEAAGRQEWLEDRSESEKQRKPEKTEFPNPNPRHNLFDAPHSLFRTRTNKREEK